MVMRPIDVEDLRRRFRTSKPFPFVSVDDFLELDFASEVAASYPSFDDARRLGHTFKAVNERWKVQITDASRFPEPVGRLAAAINSPAFVSQLSRVTGVEGLLADPEFAGGGIHQTGPRGRLDVHVDFNYLETRGLYRRLNLLLFLNPEWREEWGGWLELWDHDVKVRHHAFAPIHNRCVVFETSDHSFHGVTAVTCPSEVSRKSFAAYDYTRKAPASFRGHHSTVFRARPDERLKRYVWMPAEGLKYRAQRGVHALRRRVARALGRRR